MNALVSTPVRLLAIALGTLVLATAAYADDLPAPHVARAGAVPSLRSAVPPLRSAVPSLRSAVPALKTRAAPSRAVKTPARAAAAPRAVPGYLTGTPSAPVADNATRRHSTYVPPLGAARTSRVRRPVAARTSVPPAPKAAARTGRVPTTTFRRVPTETFRRAAQAPRVVAKTSTYAPPVYPAYSVPKPRAVTPRAVNPRAVNPRATNPRTTTWRPRPVPVAPTTRMAPRSATSRVAALPAPSVRKVSPSYAELERTRAHSMTSRARASTTPSRATTTTRRRTLQRRGGRTTTSRRSAVTTRRPAVRSNDLSVPMAPGQSAPRAPTRRVLPLTLPPGCCDDG